MMTITIRRTLLATVVLLTPAAATAGSLTAFHSLADWSAASPGTTRVEDFSSAGIDSSGFYDVVTGLCDGLGIRSSVSGGTISGGGYSDSLFWGFGFGGPEDAPQLQFGSGIRAFGADWNLGQLYGGLMMRVTFGDGSISTSVVAEALGGTFNGFFGVVSDEAISSIQLFAPSFTSGQSFSMDNARIVETPEPATGLLLLLGSGAAGAYRRFRRQQP
jgi:hypothetical protein